jgi:uncharacterized protein (TIGR02145 family)
MKKMENLPTTLLVVFALVLIMVTGCKKENEPLTVTDADGNVYKTVVIGTQTWIAENLKTTKYNAGEQIPNVTAKSQWDNLTSDAYCWYNNDAAANKTTYGALYNWYAVNTGKLCPTGWHIPSDTEWETLIDNVGGRDYAGGKLKEKGTSHWKSPNTDASDEYGFRALPAGDRYPGSGYEFWGIGEYCAFWSSTSTTTTTAVFLEAYFDSETTYQTSTNKRFGFSVRCIKN